MPLTLVLTGVDTKGADFTIQTGTSKTKKPYSPSIGDSFGTYFKLNGVVSDLSGKPQCGLIEYGDTSFTLCKGAPTLKIQ